MAAYGSNSTAVRFFRTEVPEGQTEKVLTELPPGSPLLGSLTPGGGRDYGPPGPGRRRTGPRDLPWKSWLQSKQKTNCKRKKNRFASLMG
jgi:hypothetical protein